MKNPSLKIRGIKIGSRSSLLVLDLDETVAIKSKRSEFDPNYNAREPYNIEKANVWKSIHMSHPIRWIRTYSVTVSSDGNTFDIETAKD